MEGPPHDKDDIVRPTYRAYQPQSFDEDAAGGPPARGLTPAEGEFQQGHQEALGHLSKFEDRPREESGPETDFASLKFQRENTLLTNAESYAASIREEAQLYVRQLRGEVDALNREAEQRYEEAERAKAEVQADAERLMAETKTHVDEIREEARGEGFAAGQAEGLKQRYEEAAPYLEQLEQVLTEISQFRRRVAFYTEKDGVRLALLIAKKILQSELKTNKQVVARLLASSLAKLEGKGTFRVWLNPDDYQFILAARTSLERFLDEEQTLALRAKPDLPPGNVLIETDREVIDLTFQSQFYHLEQQLNQTLAERETTLQKRRPAAVAPGATASQGKPGVGNAPDGARSAASRPARPAELRAERPAPPDVPLT